MRISFSRYIGNNPGLFYKHGIDGPRWRYRIFAIWRWQVSFNWRRWRTVDTQPQTCPEVGQRLG